MTVRKDVQGCRWGDLLASTKSNQKYTNIMAKAIFYTDSTDCTLAAPNAQGGTTYTLFDSVSQLVNHCLANGIEAQPTLED